MERRSFLNAHRRAVGSLCLLLSATAVTSAAAATQQDRIGSTISGRVTNAVDGKPVAGARVELSGAGLFATTDEVGAYLLSPLPPGTYQLHVRAGDIAETRQVRVAQGSLPGLPGITVILVGTDRTVTPMVSGEYVILDLLPGPYRIRAAGEGRIPVESQITVRAGETQIDFLLVPGGD
jgi:protocatechuate 3,4-dioxygenase beta subunit